MPPDVSNRYLCWQPRARCWPPIAKNCHGTRHLTLVPGLWYHSRYHFLSIISFYFLFGTTGSSTFFKSFKYKKYNYKGFSHFSGYQWTATVLQAKKSKKVVPAHVVPPWYRGTSLFSLLTRYGAPRRQDGTTIAGRRTAATRLSVAASTL